MDKIIAITTHSKFNEDDYEYLSGKGYMNDEIIDIWNKNRFSEPQPSVTIPNCVEVANGYKVYV